VNFLLTIKISAALQMEVTPAGETIKLLDKCDVTPLGDITCPLVSRPHCLDASGNGLHQLKFRNFKMGYHPAFVLPATSING